MIKYYLLRRERSSRGEALNKYAELAKRAWENNLFTQARAKLARRSPKDYAGASEASKPWAKPKAYLYRRERSSRGEALKILKRERSELQGRSPC